MVNEIKIKNFKSVVDTTLNLGNFNVLIGENGCGKSNILEAIAFGAAASADKLDYEFLGSRGIRTTNPEFMFSAFSNEKKQKIIRLDFKVDGNEDHYFELTNDLSDKRRWIDKSLEDIRKNKKLISEVEKTKKILEEIKKNIAQDKDVLDIEKNLKKIEKEVKSYYAELSLVSFRSDISNFIIYSPEQSVLRRHEETPQIYPIGIKGEGLLQYIKEITLSKKQGKMLNNIRQNLFLLDWYKGLDISENLMKGEVGLKIEDKYLNENLKYFDQRSTNEGFLFLLFYSTLFASKITPAFFAIENIDSSLNPKLCMQLTKNLAESAKKHGKQVIVTTQNPAILDGLNLEDDNQRLFVVRRNDEGHTIAKRIEYKSERKMKLSEIWTNGFIGGLPENF